jgi:large subunit ribosomal protein L21
MYAIIETGGKQYVVRKGDTLDIELLQANPGDELVIDAVKMIGGEGVATTIGAPVIAGALIKAKVLRQTKTKKVITFKKVNRNGYHKKQGHRQKLLTIAVTEIVVPQ